MKSFPHPLAILLSFIVLATLLTHLLPAGQYQRIADPETGRDVIVPGSYQQTEAEPVGFFEMFVKVPEGVVFGADIVILILIIGGAFVVIDKTGAFNEGLHALIRAFPDSQFKVLIVLGVVFATVGFLNNTFEEIIAMIPFLVVLGDRLGYRRVSMVAISAGSAAIGATFSPINPFGTLLAQKVADVEPLSGWAFRVILFLIALTFWISWVIRNGKDESVKSTTLDMDHDTAFSIRSGIILSLFVITFGVMVYGILEWNWDYNQMSALFFGMGILCGFIGKLGINGTSKAYATGFQEMAFAAVVVGLARSMYLIFDDGQIIDTMVYGLFTPLEEVPVALSAVGMTLSQALLHIPVASNSGQAVLTMPLLAPLADLLGMSRQVMIMCYQFGAILMDLITPTNGALLAMLVAAKSSYKEWIQFCIKPYLLLLAFGLVAIFVAIGLGL
ncbi:MAG: Na+/H+ antiporter NhaC family protein [Bacteroidota bacterium]